MLNDDLTLKGHLSIAVNGEVVKQVPNLVVTAGKNYVASRMKDATRVLCLTMAIGTGTQAQLLVIQRSARSLTVGTPPQLLSPTMS